MVWITIQMTFTILCNNALLVSFHFVDIEVFSPYSESRAFNILLRLSLSSLIWTLCPYRYFIYFVLMLLSERLQKSPLFHSFIYCNQYSCGLQYQTDNVHAIYLVYNIFFWVSFHFVDITNAARIVSYGVQKFNLSILSV